MGLGKSGHIDFPSGDEFAKGFIVNQTNVEIRSTMIDNRFNCEMNIWLVQIGGISAVKILPLAGVFFVSAVNPKLGSVHTIKG